MNRTKFLSAFLVASVFGVLSVLMIRAPEEVGPAAILALPGSLAAIVASGNIHAFSPWIVVVGNFIFYFALVCLIWSIWGRLHTRRHNP